MGLDISRTNMAGLCLFLVVLLRTIVLLIGMHNGFVLLDCRVYVTILKIFH